MFLDAWRQRTRLQFRLQVRPMRVVVMVVSMVVVFTMVVAVVMMDLIVSIMTVGMLVMVPVVMVVRSVMIMHMRSRIGRRIGGALAYVEPLASQHTVSEI